MKINITYGNLKNAIKLTKGFTSKSCVRPILETVKIEALNNTVKFIATDSYKLINHEITEGIEIIEEGTCNILPKEIDALLKAFVVRNEVVVTLETSSDSKYLTISYGDYKFTIKPILKEYPNTNRLIPTEEEPNEPTYFDLHNLIEAVKSLVTAGNHIEVRTNKNELKSTVLTVYNSYINSSDKTTALILPIKGLKGGR